MRTVPIRPWALFEPTVFIQKQILRLDLYKTKVKGTKRYVLSFTRLNLLDCNIIKYRMGTLTTFTNSLKT